MLIDGHHLVRRNVMRDLSGDSNWTVTIYNSDAVFKYNIIEDTRLALRVEGGIYVDAELNYWGHSTGPYHPLLNPLGRGDEVSDSVDFDPWYHDTLFFSASPEPRPPLPESASILAYPNPFNSVATIKLTVPRAMIARIELFDVTGRRVKELWSGAVADEKTLTWQADEFASGLYFVRAWDPLGNRPLALAKVVLLR